MGLIEEPRHSLLTSSDSSLRQQLTQTREQLEQSQSNCQQLQQKVSSQ